MGKGEKMVPLKKTNSVITLLGDFCFFFFQGLVLLFYIMCLLGISVAVKRAVG